MAESFRIPLFEQRHVTLRRGNTDFTELRCVIPDMHYKPRLFVYFDFLRGTVIDPLSIKDNPKPYDRDFYEEYMDAVIEKINLFVMTSVIGISKGYTSVIKTASDSVNCNDPPYLMYKQNLINFFLNQILSDVQISRSRTGPGTANITFRPEQVDRKNMKGFVDPSILFNPEARHKFDQVLGPDVFVYIYAQGRVYPQWYYPVYTGLTNSTTYGASNGFETLTVQAEDPTKVLRLTYYNFNAALSDPTVVTLFTDSQNQMIGLHPFAGVPADEIVTALTTGNVNVDWIEKIQPGGIIDPKTNKPQEINNVAQTKIYGALDYKVVKEGVTRESSFLIKELEERKTYLLNDKNEKIPLITGLESLTQNIDTLTKIRENYLILWGTSLDVNPYIEYFGPTAQVFTSDFQRRLDTIREVAQRTFAEFYADGAGHLHFHPMRISAAFLENQFLTTLGKTSNELLEPNPESLFGIFIIPKEEIITSSYTASDAELTTFLAVSGQHPMSLGIDPAIGNLKFTYPSVIGGELKKPANEIEDVHIRAIRRFGYRRRDVLNPLINYADDGDLARYAQKQYLLVNKDNLSASVNIIFRPELEIARPIFIPHRRELYYIDSITHSYSVGGVCQTTLGLTLGRPDSDSCYSDLIDFLIQNWKAYTENRVNELKGNDNIREQQPENKKPKPSLPPRSETPPDVVPESSVDPKLSDPEELEAFNDLIDTLNDAGMYQPIPGDTSDIAQPERPVTYDTTSPVEITFENGDVVETVVDFEPPSTPASRDDARTKPVPRPPKGTATTVNDSIRDNSSAAIGGAVGGGLNLNNSKGKTGPKKDPKKKPKQQDGKTNVVPSNSLLIANLISKGPFEKGVPQRFEKNTNLVQRIKVDSFDPKSYTIQNLSPELLNMLKTFGDDWTNYRENLELNFENAIKPLDYSSQLKGLGKSPNNIILSSFSGTYGESIHESGGLTNEKGFLPNTTHAEGRAVDLAINPPVPIIAATTTNAAADVFESNLTIGTFKIAGNRIRVNTVAMFLKSVPNGNIISFTEFAQNPHNKKIYIEITEDEMKANKKVVKGKTLIYWGFVVKAYFIQKLLFDNRKAYNLSEIAGPFSQFNYNKYALHPFKEGHFAWNSSPSDAKVDFTVLALYHDQIHVAIDKGSNKNTGKK